MNSWWRSKVCFKKTKQSAEIVSDPNLSIRCGHRNQLGGTHRNQTGPQSGPKLDPLFCSQENKMVRYRTASVHTRTERYDIVSFQFLVHFWFSELPNFWTCFGADGLIFFRTRVDTTPLRTTFWEVPKWNDTISYPCRE